MDIQEVLTYLVTSFRAQLSSKRYQKLWRSMKSVLIWRSQKQNLYIT